jgi:hypothetical protein
MRRTLAVCAAGLIAFLALPAGPAAAQPGLSVTLSAERVSASVGDRITVRARVDNRGTVPSEALVAHLSVVTLDPKVYVDLEDWTASPTQQVVALPPGGSATASWEIQAVNAGRFDVYVVALGKEHVVSQPTLVEVAGKRKISAGGVLPVTVVVPVLLGLAAFGVRMLRRRAD